VIRAKILVGRRGKLHPSGSTSMPGTPGTKLSKSLACEGGSGGVSSSEAVGFLSGEEARQYPETLISHSDVPTTGSRGGRGLHHDCALPDELAELCPGPPGEEVEAPRVIPSWSSSVVMLRHCPLDWAAWEHSLAIAGGVATSSRAPTRKIPEPACFSMNTHPTSTARNR